MSDLLAGLDRRERLRIVESERVRCRRRYLDTFDRTLARRDSLLEFVEGRGGRRLRWLSYGGAVEFECAVDAVPRFAGDVPMPAFAAALEAHIGVRALLETGTQGGSLCKARVLDRRDKTVLKLERWTPVTRGGRPYVHLLPMKGYEEALRHVRRALRGTSGAASLDRALALESSRAPGPPRARDERPDGAVRADTGFKRVLLGFLHVMEDQHAAVLADFDTECLHDFRVAARRSRSLLARTGGVLPAAAIRRFSKAFAWLSKVTGPVRDLDVYALELERRAREGDEFARSMLPAVVAQRRRHFEAMARALRSSRFRRFRAAWSAFLEAPAPTSTRLADAARPLAEVAGERTHATYRKLVRRGRSIDDGTPMERVHDLRKTAKKVRYMFEAFGGLWKDEALKDTVRRLKKFQTYLGDVQDLCVQCELLGDLVLQTPSRPVDAPLSAQRVAAGYAVGRECNCLVDDARERAIAEVERLDGLANELRAGFAARFARFDAKGRHRALRSTLAGAAGPAGA